MEQAMPSIMPTGKQQFTNNAGVPLAGGRVYTYGPGTTEPKATYQDAAGTVANANPIVLDARGEALAFWKGAYAVKVTDANGVLIYTVDNYEVPLMAGDLSADDGADKVSGTWYAGAKAKLSALKEGSGPALIGFIQASVGAVIRSLLDKNRDTIHIRDFGAVCNGIADDTQALIKADAAAVARGKTLIIDGTPLIKQALVFAGKSHWRFEGGAGVLDAGNDPSASRLIKHASVNGALATFTANGVVLEGIAVSGQPGNVGDGLVFWGNSPRVIGAYVTQMGQDGIRLGREAGQAANVNSFYFENPRCISNGRDGINMNDEPGGAPDVNAGSLVNPICTSNGRHGFYGGNAFLGVTIMCPTMEANTGYGMYLDEAFRQNVIIGGDCEANVAGDMYRFNKYSNVVIGTSVMGKTIYDRAQLSSYVPVIYGADVAGACAYTSQLGEFEVSGATVQFAAQITYTGHTGTGQTYVSLPLPPYVGAANIAFMPVQVVVSGLVLQAGAQVIGLVNRDGNRIQLYTNNAGVLGSLPLPAAGTFYIRGSYPLNAPNFFAL